jgi:two-component system, NtrC family, sensor kinase
MTARVADNTHLGPDTNAFPPDTFERVIRALNVAYYEWTPGSEEIRVSSALAAMFGFDQRSWTLRRQLALIHPDDLPHYVAAMTACFKGGTDWAEFSFRIRAASGAYRWALVHNLVERGATGRVTRMTGTVSDITEAKEREEQNRNLIAREAASIEVLKAISSSPDDPQPVFELIARRGRELCNAAQASVTEYDGVLLHMRARDGYDLTTAQLGDLSWPQAPNPDTVHGRVALSGAMVHVRDLADDGNHAGGSHHVMMRRRLGSKSLLGVPLLRNGRVVGTIAFGRVEMGGFDAAEVALVEAFAEQAVIAIASAATLGELRTRTNELAQRNSEYGERIEQQSATIDVLKVMSASPGDTRPVFELIVERARAFCEADHAMVALLDGDMLHLQAHTGMTAADARDYEARFPRPLGPSTMFGRAILARDAVQTPDVSADPEHFSGVGGARAVAHSIIAVPLMRAGTPIGAIAIGRGIQGEFSATQVELLRTFAEQAVIAVGSAETYRELQTRTAELAQRNSEYGERIEQQSATIDVLKVMAASPGDAQPVFELIVERARAFCDADQATVALLDGDMLCLQAHNGMTAPDAREYEAQFPRPVDTASMFGRAIIAREAVQIPDASVDPEHFSRTRVGGPQFLAIVAVPLLRAGTPIGAIALGRRIPGVYSATQRELLQTFAEQAVIAIGSAETYRELQERTAALAERNSEYGERIEQQSATIDVLKAMSASPGDTQPVFDLIARRAAELCEARAGLWEFDGTLMHYRAGHGVDPETAAAFARQFPRPPDSGTVAGRSILGRQVIHIPNIAADPDISQAARDLGGSAIVAIPLLRDGAAIGSIALNAMEPGGFSDSQLALLQTFAEQAVIAIGSAETYRELQARTAALAARNSEYGEQIEQQSATIDVLKAMSASPGDTKPVFDLIVRRAQELCNSATAGLLEFDGELVRLVSYYGDDPTALATYASLFPMPPTRASIACRAILEKRIIHIRDMDGERDLLPAVRNLGKRSNLSLPLLRHGDAIGVITLNAPDAGGFSDSQVALLQTFAEQAVIAIGSAETYRELQARTAALAARNSEYGERIEQQSATIDVLRAMSASPGDARPIFELIVERAIAFCEADGAGVALLEGEMLRLQAYVNHPNPSAYESSFPQPVSDATMFGRAILARDAVQMADSDEDEGYGLRTALGGESRSMLGVPLFRAGTPIGAISIVRRRLGAFSATHVELLKTFAEQAVIAIGSAETYRELQNRTAALAARNSEYGERIEQQSATIDVLKAMSSSPGDTQPVFDLITRRARELCNGVVVGLMEYDGELIHVRSTSAIIAPAAHAAFLAQFPMRPTSASIACRAILEKQIIHIRDADAEPGLFQAIRDNGTKSILAIPLLREGAVIGSIALNAMEPGGFSDSQVALLQTFAEQAVIAIGSAETYRELQARTTALAERNSEYGERIEHQSATIDVLKAMSASPDDTQPVFDLIARRAQQLCNGASVGLFEFDGTLVYARASSGGNGAAIAAFQGMFPMEPTRGSLACRAILDRQIVHISDMNAEPGLLPAVRDMGAKSTLSLPLLRDNRAIGAMSLNSKEVGGFSDNQIELLKTFAEQAVIAVGSADTFRELRDRTAALTRSVAELRALEEVLRAVNSSLDLDTVLATIISRAVQLSEADEGTIYEFDETEEVFVPKAAFGMTAKRLEALRERRIRIGETPLGNSAAMRAPLHIPDLTRTSDADGAPELVDAGIHALLAVPLLREDKVVGGLVIRRRAAGGFAPTIPTLLQTFAGQSVLAIENARLFLEARRARTAAETTLADLRRAQDRLVQSEKMASLGQLTAGIAHEIKNPLNFVNNFSELSVDLLDELHDAVSPDKVAIANDLRAEIDELTATLKGNLEKIAQHGRRADSIVKNMLLHSRSGPSEHRAIDLNTTVEEALNLAYHGARAETPGFNITLEKDLDPKAGTVDLYPQEFIRVLLNLIGNGFYAARNRASQAADRDFEPTLRLTTRDLGEQAEIRVRDNGTGISDEVRDKIFEPFFTTKPAGEGTGLGLSLSYDIVVKQHGGQLTVDSLTDAFTEFVITLPRGMAVVADVGGNNDRTHTGRR